MKNSITDLIMCGLTDFVGMHVEDEVFTGTWVGLTFSNVTFENCCFSLENFISCTFSDVVFNDCSFVNTVGLDIKLTDIQVSGCKVSNVTLLSPHLVDVMVHSSDINSVVVSKAERLERVYTLENGDMNYKVS